MIKFFLSIALTSLFLSSSFAATVESCMLNDALPNNYANVSISESLYADQTFDQNNFLIRTNYSPRTCENINLANKVIDISILSISFAETLCLVSPEPVSKPVAVTMHVSGMLLAELKFLVQIASDECSRNEILSEARHENELIIKNTVINYLEQQGAQIRGVK